LLNSSSWILEHGGNPKFQKNIIRDRFWTVQIMDCSYSNPVQIHLFKFCSICQFFEHAHERFLNCSRLVR
jgi:hypothetical protein